MNDDVEYHATREGMTDSAVFNTWAQAIEYIRPFSGIIDVVVYSELGAFAYGGDDAVEYYMIDPDASVFERWEIMAGIPTNCMGMVP